MRRSTRLAALAAGLSLATALTGCSGSSDGGTKTPTRSATPSRPKAVASYASLTGATTSLTLGSAFRTTLARFGVSPTATAPATAKGDTFTFPISGGHAIVYGATATPRFTGVVNHTGGLSLTSGSTRIEVQKLILTLGSQPTVAGSIVFNGKSLGASLTMFDVDASTATTPVTSGGTTTVSGATVYVDPQAAVALNAALQLPDSQALPTAAKALAVGTATITLTG